MRIIAAAILFGMIGTSIVSCVEKRMLIQPRMVESAEIMKRGDDSVRQLGEQEAVTFVIAWNDAKAIGPCKFVFDYKVDLHLKTGRTIKYRTSDQNIKAEDDYCFSVEQEGTFDQLWASGGSR